jgi:hypothetical protein
MKFLHKILAKQLIFKNEDIVPVGKLSEKNMGEKYFFHP